MSGIMVHVMNLFITMFFMSICRTQKILHINVLTIFSSADVAVSLVTCRVLPLPSRHLQRRKLWPISTRPASICGSTERHANPTSVDSAENITKAEKSLKCVT